MKPLSNHERHKLLESIAQHNDCIRHGERPSRGFAKHVRAVKSKLTQHGISFPTVAADQVGSLERASQANGPDVETLAAGVQDLAKLYDQCPEEFQSTSSEAFNIASRVRQRPGNAVILLPELSPASLIIIEYACDKVYSLPGVCVLAWLIDHFKPSERPA